MTTAKREMILAALASSAGATYTPVQVQKLLFLVNAKVPGAFGGKAFKFTPYDYGPFDSSVYRCLEELDKEGLVEIETSANPRWRRYRLTESGQAAGEETLGGLDDAVASYIRDLSKFVRSLSFTELVSAIYKAYPAMRARSVFRG